ncbi:phage holin family protein [Flavobacterium salilacus subsp. salilacus]|uniref:phage holin family protein n=1 Tax=Flavobacterium TaxID=237 RepID=UPI001074ED3C|nr:MULTISPECIES: phage holin family protein [Flavobacterium]KAF2518201.1 phage holin family protein [Flavobacterium salilacus subsp. salilacus]MBE1615486.1 phage holin family protein [Flavobacterium sp. SaA2.13]
MKTLIKIFFTTIFVLLLSYLLPGITVTGWMSALLVALVLGLLNIFVKPILIIFTLPATILTLGLFLLIINAVIIMLCSALVPGFDVPTFWHALLFSIVLSICQSLVSGMSDREET